MECEQFLSAKKLEYAWYKHMQGKLGLTIQDVKIHTKTLCWLDQQFFVMETDEVNFLNQHCLVNERHGDWCSSIRHES
jgi:hypothetical protein